MSKIVIINGANGAGKDTFVNFVTQDLGDHNVLNISTIDCIKQVARNLGWDGQKTDSARKMLSELKRISIDFNDYPYVDCVNKISLFEQEREYYGVSTDKCIIFIHCREPEEIEKYKKRLNATTLLITNSRVKPAENSSDLGVFDYEYDYVIDNSKGFIQLHQAAAEFCDRILKGERT